jgi:TolB-like protein/Tfp pilus assembly protein PilF
MGAGQTSFGPFILDRGAQTLLSGGKRVALGQRGFALLDALASADAKVSKADLIEAAWPGTIVEDGNLTVQIAALRKALGTRPDGQEWIVTVPRVGYRLLRGSPTATAAWVADLRPSVAELPFASLGADPEQDYFADGVVEDIITALSRFRSFAVVARDSSFAYKGRLLDVRQVALELGVRYLLTGRRQRGGNRLRISAQLVDGETGVHLWAQNFDGTPDDVFEMQDRVTENVVAIVEPRITGAEMERSRRKPPESVDLHDQYLRALPDIYAGRPESISRAIALLEEVISRDPAFAIAVTMAGQACLLRVVMQLEGVADQDVSRCITLARAALATGSDDPAVLSICGFILTHIAQEYEEGLALLSRAFRENPNHPIVLNFIGIGHLIAGDLEEGAAHLERSVRLNPNDLGAHWQLTGIAHIRAAQGRYEEAIGVASRSLAVNTNYLSTYWVLIAANAYLGRLEVAREFVARLQTVSPGVTLSMIKRGQVYQYPGRIDVLVEGMRLAGVPER